MSDKVDFKTKGVTGLSKGHLVLIKGAIYLEDIAIINMFVLITAFKLHEEKIDRIKWRNRQIYSHS